MKTPEFSSVNLSEEDCDINVMNWYCVYTKPKQEDVVCHKLISIEDVSFFNPKVKVKRINQGRIKETVEALFPRYIFVKFDLLRYYHLIKNTRGVSRIVGDGTADPIVVDQSVIETIRRGMEHGVDMATEPVFTPGEKVTVSGGPFNELEGIFMGQLNKDNRVRILFKIIGYQATIEVNRESVIKRHACSA